MHIIHDCGGGLFSSIIITRQHLQQYILYFNLGFSPLFMNCSHLVKLPKCWNGLATVSSDLRKSAECD